MTRTVFVDKENKATFTCPSCTKSRTVEVGKFLRVKASAKLKAKCPCGNSYTVVLERRKFYRKDTKLHGVFVPETTGKEIPMTVSNLSRSGLRFLTSQSSGLEIGARVTVEFRLDDKRRSLIKKKAIIKKVEDRAVGSEFCFVDEQDKVLGFYLFK
jgi:hypothetical protein